MRKLFLLFTLCFSINLYSQTTSSTTTESSTESYVSSSNDKVNSHTRVSQTKHYYKFSADFNSSKNKKVLQLLIDRLGKGSIQKGSNKQTWRKENNQEVVFTCEFSDGKVSITLNNLLASDQEEEEMKALGTDLRLLITQHKNMGDPHNNWRYHAVDPQLKKQERLRQAELELERAKRNLERIKQEEKKKE